MTGVGCQDTASLHNLQVTEHYDVGGVAGYRHVPSIEVAWSLERPGLLSLFALLSPVDEPHTEGRGFVASLPEETRCEFKKTRL